MEKNLKPMLQWTNETTWKFIFDRNSISVVPQHGVALMQQQQSCGGARLIHATAPQLVHSWKMGKVKNTPVQKCNDRHRR